MTQPRPSIAQVMAPTVAVAAVGCSALADGNQAVSSVQWMASAGSVLARTVTLLSAPAGLPEGTVVNQPSMVAMNGVTLPEPTPCVVTHTESWAAPFPGASYVSSCPDCGSALPRCGGGYTPEAPSSVSFVDTFDLPPGFSSPSFSMTTTNDDAANVYVNGAASVERRLVAVRFPVRSSPSFTARTRQSSEWARTSCATTSRTSTRPAPCRWPTLRRSLFTEARERLSW